MTRDEVIAALRAQEAALKRAGIRHVGLFGSTARGAAHPGDMDLLIALDDAKPTRCSTTAGCNGSWPNSSGPTSFWRLSRCRRCDCARAWSGSWYVPSDTPVDALEDILENIARIERFIGAPAGRPRGATVPRHRVGGHPRSGQLAPARV